MESYLHQENQRENDFSAGLRVEVPTGFSVQWQFHIQQIGLYLSAMAMFDRLKN